MKTQYPVLLLLPLILLPSTAWAYVDPGSGAMIAQLLAAAGFGVLFYFRRILRFVRKIFRLDAKDLQQHSINRDTK